LRSEVITDLDWLINTLCSNRSW